MSISPAIGLLPDYLVRAAQVTPDKVAFRFLPGGERAVIAATYSEMADRARLWATRLAAITETGDRAILLIEPGLDFAAALYACFLSGVVAVPVPAPHPNRIAVQSDRLLQVVRDCAPTLILTTSNFMLRIAQFAGVGWELAAPIWLSIDDDRSNMGIDPLPTKDPLPTIDPHGLALLQYTSGSTSDPRGVMLTHANLLANQQAIARIAGDDCEHVFFAWVPPYHDMGMAFLLQPVFLGASVVLMPPGQFIQSPTRWARALSDYRCTFTAGPNFALDRLIDSLTPDGFRDIDLSCMRAWAVGAEPVRAATLERSDEALARFGLPKDVFRPCYGLAEITMLATCTPAPRGARLRRFSTAALALTSGSFAQEVSNGDDDQRQTALAGNGDADPAHRVLIVDPATATPLADGMIGEVWLRGPSVGCGYWGLPKQSAQVFNAEPEPPDGETYLRAGDLGFVLNEDLFVVGRLKEMIIVRGRNLYPVDLEEVAERAHPAVLAAAAFEMSPDDGGIGLVVELHRNRRDTISRILDHVRRETAQRCEVEIAAITAVPQNRLPRTSSGKVQRDLTRRLLLAGELECIEEQSATTP